MKRDSFKLSTALILGVLLCLAVVVKDVWAADTLSNTTNIRNNISEINTNIVIPENETIHGDVNTVNGNITVKGCVIGNIDTINGNVEVYGSVTGNVKTVNGTISTKSTGVIIGTQESIKTKLWSTNPPQEYTVNNYGSHKIYSILFIIFMIGVVIITPIVIMVAIVLLAPEKVTFMSSELMANPWESLGHGFLMILATIGIILGLCITCIGIPLVPLVGIVAAVLWLTAGVVVAVAVGTWLRDKFKWQITSVMVLMLIGALAFAIIKIAVVGIPIALVMAIAGYGTVIKTRFGKRPMKMVPVVQTPPPAPPVPPAPPASVEDVTPEPVVPPEPVVNPLNIEKPDVTEELLPPPPESPENPDTENKDLQQ